MSSLQMGNGNEQTLEKHPKMLTIRQIDYTIDSIKKSSVFLEKKLLLDMKPLFKFSKFSDSGWLKKDTFKFKSVTTFNKLIPDSIKTIVYQMSLATVNTAIGNISTTVTDYRTKFESLRAHQIEWHKRFTYSLACLVLFLIGAPLGSIIRKGGLGTPLVFAIIFFAIFYLLNTFGEKFSKEYVMSSFAGIWLSTFVLVPVAFFLIYKALKDSQLFNGEFYFRLFRRIKSFTATFRKVKTTNEKVNI
jgi:lipopolysaccharide export system permease protein